MFHHDSIPHSTVALVTSDSTVPSYIPSFNNKSWRHPRNFSGMAFSKGCEEPWKHLLGLQEAARRHEPCVDHFIQHTRMYAWQLGLRSHKASYIEEARPQRQNGVRSGALKQLTHVGHGFVRST
jgi:hypothetical protein